MHLRKFELLKGSKDLLGSSRTEPSLVGIGNLISGVIGGIFWLVLAAFVPVTEYGQLNYYISLGTILSIVSLLGLSLTVMTFLPKGNLLLKRQADFLVLVSSSIMVLSVWAFSQNYSLALMCLGMIFFTMTNAQVLGAKEFRTFPLLAIGQRISQFALSLAFYLILGIDGLFLGYALSLLLFSYKFIKDLLHLRAQELSGKYGDGNKSFSSIRLGAVKEKSRFIMHAYMTSVAQSMTSYSDKLLIAPVFGFTMLGMYQLGFQFLMFLAVIPISLTQYLIPREAAGMGNSKLKKIGIILAIAVASVSYFLIGSMIELLLPSYSEAIPAAQIMVLAIVPMTINAIINAKLLGSERSFPVVLGSGVYVSLLFILFYVFGTNLGLIGLSVALVVALSTQSAILMFWKYIPKLPSQHS